jgi:hypothetical protein
MISVSWEQLKNIAIEKTIGLQYTEDSYSYKVFCSEGSVIYMFDMIKSDPASVEQEDFETNYKETSNQPNKQAIEVIIDTYAASSLAVDKYGTDQVIGSSEWTVLTSERIIWDINSDYSKETDDFVVPYNGIFFHDGQFKFKNMSGVSEIEIALFKRGVENDDYWFVLAHSYGLSGVPDIQISTGTSFDFYTGESYCVKIKLSGSTPSATVDGSDDYTSWGYTFSRRLR